MSLRRQSSGDDRIGPTGKPATARSVRLAQNRGAEWFATQALGPCVEYVTEERLDEYLSGFPEPLRSDIRAALPGGSA